LAVDTLLRKWRVAQTGKSHFEVTESEERRLLQPLAHWMHIHAPTGLLRESKVKEQLAQYMGEMRGKAPDSVEVEEGVQEFLRRVREHTGLFVERAPGQYGFMHLTFEEYFAGRELIRRSKEAASRIHARRHHPRWEEPIRLAIGYLSRESPEDASELLRTAILAQPETEEFKQSAYEDLLSRDLMLAARCLGDCEGPDVALMRDVTDRLLEIALARNERGNISPLRRQATSALRALNQVDGEVLAALLAVWQDRQEGEVVRGYAALALGDLGKDSPEVLAALLAVLQNGQERERVRQDAASALGNLGKDSPEVLAALLAVWQDGQERERCGGMRPWRWIVWARTVPKSSPLCWLSCRMDRNVNGCGGMRPGHWEAWARTVPSPRRSASSLAGWTGRRRSTVVCGPGVG